MPLPGRNESCPCGSGRKFKHCCAVKKDRSSGIIALVLVGAVLAAIILAVTRARPASGGSVWSAEHGHYHDASGREVAQ